MAKEALGKSFKRLCAIIAGCDAGASYPAYGEPGRIIRTPHPAYFKAAFSPAFAGLFIFGGGNPRRAKQRQTGEE